jgi:hypothetical protein
MYSRVASKVESDLGYGTDICAGYESHRECHEADGDAQEPSEARGELHWVARIAFEERDNVRLVRCTFPFVGMGKDTGVNDSLVREHAKP